MSNLEQDLLQSQQKIVSLLTQYEKVSEDIIKSNYTTQLHNLLNTITTFDHAKIRQCQSIFQDETIAKYIHTISDLIKQKEEVKPKVQQKSIEKAETRKKQEVKREPRIAQKKEQKSGGLFNFVKNKFTSKEKKPTQMILPDQEPKCYYDQKTKSWIFEGEEPEPPKTIPKPPSAAEKKVKEETKKVSQGKQVDQLTAPPAFKRKSTPGAVNAKGKAKIKETIQIQKNIEEPLTFVKMVEHINSTYFSILQKVRSGAYQHHHQDNKPNNFDNFIDFAQKTLQISEEIGEGESKVMEKWSRLIASESRQLKIMEKVLHEMEQSAKVYHQLAQQINSKSSQSQGQTIVIKEVIKQVIRYVQRPQNPALSQGRQYRSQTIIDKPKASSRVKEQSVKSRSQQSVSKVPIKLDKECQTFSEQKQQRVQEQKKRTQLSLANEEIFDLKQKLDNVVKENNELNSAIAKYQVEIQQVAIELQSRQSVASDLKLQIFQLTELNNKLTNHAEHLAHQLRNKEGLMDNLQIQLRISEEILMKTKQEHALELKEVNLHNTEQQKIYLQQINQLEANNNKLLASKLQLQQKSAIEKARSSSNLQKANSQLTKQKAQIQSQLKAAQQKQKIYIGSIKLLQEQMSTAQQYQWALNQQNQLLNSILEKRIQLHNKNPEVDDLPIVKKSQEPSSTSLILQLSSIINSITQTHLDRSEAFSRTYSKLQKKYMAAKETVNELKNKSANQNLSLNRSVSKLKNLVQTYKIGKDEAEERCSQVELQCEKLRKKLQHYKEEDEFNRSFISRVKSSKMHSNNQSVLSLQEDKEELASEIDDLKKELAQRDSLLKKNQNDLEDLLANYEKNQKRMTQVQKKWRENQKELRNISQQYQQECNKSKLLELKLQNQKEKCQQIQVRQESRLKNSENNFEKRIKLMKNEVEELKNIEAQLTRQMEQLHQHYSLKIRALQSDKQASLQELSKGVAEKEQEMNQLILALEQQLNNQKQEKMHLQSKYKVLLQRQKQLGLKLRQVAEQHLLQITIHQSKQDNLNNIIKALNQRLNSYHQEAQSFHHQYNRTIYQISQQLKSSNTQTTQLQAQLNQYSQSILQLTQQVKGQKTHSQQIRKLLQENKDLQGTIQGISQEVERLGAINESLMRDKMDIQQKLHLKEQQVQTLLKQKQQMSSDIMIKDQQLQQKERRLLEVLQQSVLKKEQLDELKNQVLKMKQQLSHKQQTITELQTDIQSLLQEQNNKEDFTLLQNQLSSIKMALQNKQQHIEALNSKIHQYIVDIQGKDDKIKVQEEMIENSKLQIQELNSVLIQLSQQAETSSHTISQLQSQITSKLQQHSLLQAQIQHKDQQIKSLLRQIQLTNAEKESQKDKQIQENDEFQRQMEILLKEMEAKDKQIQNTKVLLQQKQQKINSLLKETNDLQGRVKIEQATIDRLTAQLQSQKTLYLDSLDNMKDQIQKLQTENSQMQQLLENLSLQAEQNKRGQMDNKILSEELRMKEQSIAQMAQMNKKIAGESEKDRSLKEQQIAEMKLVLSQKTRRITVYEIGQQQRERTIQELNKNIQEQEQKIAELQDNLVQMAEIIEKQEKVIQQFKTSKTAHESQSVKTITAMLEQRNGEVQELKKKIQETARRVSEKEGQYEKKIQSLQREIITSNSLRAANKKLQENIAALQDQNKLLQSEKVELMKSNNYLVSINQKLIEEKSPHKKQASKGQTVKNQKERAQKGGPGEPQKQVKKQSAGFFASLFLTPSESERLRK